MGSSVRDASQPCAGSSTPHPDPPLVSFKNKLHVQNPRNFRAVIAALVGALAPSGVFRIVAIFEPLNVRFQLVDLLLDGADPRFRTPPGFRSKRSIPPVFRGAQRLLLYAQASARQNKLVFNGAFDLLDAAIEQLLLACRDFGLISEDHLLDGISDFIFGLYNRRGSRGAPRSLFQQPAAAVAL